LNAHSKGDDDRDPAEVARFREKDYLNLFQSECPAYYERYHSAIEAEVNSMVDEIMREEELSIDAYYDQSVRTSDNNWGPLSPINKRQVELLNKFFQKKITECTDCVFLGEDILSPYGGAFKVTRELSDVVPERVFSTPISESAIVGISNGLALNGFKPFAEIMFGDFMTLAMDQIVNHAAKFHHMYNKKVNCPVVVRTPMGGRRGYGPTHSQTLDKFIVGIDNVTTVALNTFVDPAIIYESVYQSQHPVLVIENKTDYGKKILHYQAKNFLYERNQDLFPVVRVRPAISNATLTVVAYGGMADIVNLLLDEIFFETEQKIELIIPSVISHTPIEIIFASVQETGNLLVIEEGSAFAGIGSELITQLKEKMEGQFRVKRISAYPVPIPSVKSLEHIVLPEKDRIIKEIKESFS
jgi:2-oxoisovalerate dehydrogenase E1 component